MTEIAQVTSTDGLARLSELLHDQWFDLDDVRFLNADALLKVVFGETGSGKLADRGQRALLTVRHVESYRVQDSQQIGRYDFNVILYDSSIKRLTVLTGIPCVFWMIVRRLELILEVDDSEIGSGATD